MTQAQTETRTVWNLDPAHSQVEFRVKHMMITTVRGQFGKVEGRIELDDENPSESSVSVTIDASSIDTRNQDRDTHLRSADFLGAEEHGTIEFRSTRVEGEWKEPGDVFKVHGDLTIRGVSKPVVLDAIYEGEGRDPWGGDRISFTADTRIDRKDFGLKWNQALETGGVLVGEEVKIHIEAQAVRQA